MTKRKKREEIDEDRVLAIGDQYFIEWSAGVDGISGHVAVVRRRDGMAVCLPPQALSLAEHVIARGKPDHAAYVLSDLSDAGWRRYYKATHAQTAYRQACAWTPSSSEAERAYMEAGLEKLRAVYPAREEEKEADMK